MEIIFLPNGNTAVFENQEQVPRLQKSWLLFFYEFLKTEIEFNIMMLRLHYLMEQGLDGLKLQMITDRKELAGE